jgi:hypothetical protein
MATRIAATALRVNFDWDCIVALLGALKVVNKLSGLR